MKTLLDRSMRLVWMFLIVCVGYLPFNAVAETYQASTDFSATQGYRNWYYLGSDGVYMTFDYANSRWQGSEAYVLLWSSGGHPGEIADAVRRWVAPSAGNITITGNVRDGYDCGTDGVVVQIKKGSTILWQASIANGDMVGLNFNVATTVAAGEVIDFVINKGIDGSCDVTVFDPTITVDGGSPTGRLDVSTCDVSLGWACDADNYNSPLDVHFWDGPAGSGVFLGMTSANQTREAGVGAQCGGNPYHGFVFNTPAALKDGTTHTIYAYAINIGPENPNTQLISPQTFTCSAPPPSDTTPPTVTITAPANGATVSGAVTMSVNASDEVGGSGMSKVDFYVDGALNATDTTSPYSFSWNTTGVASGNHTLTANAYDNAGNVGQHQITVAVSTGTSSPIELLAEPMFANGVQHGWANTYFLNSDRYGPDSLYKKCRDDWLVRSPSLTNQWLFWEIAQNTYFCENPANPITLSPNTYTYTYSSNDGSSSNNGSKQFLIYGDGRIEWRIDTSQEWRAGCNLAADQNGVPALYKDSGWNWSHFMVGQDIKDPSDIENKLRVGSYGKITFSASVLLIDSEKLGSCASGSWDPYVIPDHELFYVTFVFNHLGNVNSAKTIYALVPMFYSDNGISHETYMGGWIGGDPVNNVVFYSPSHYSLIKGQPVSYSVDAAQILNEALTRLKDQTNNPVWDPSNENLVASDYFVREVLFGWEIWGGYKSTVQASNLSLTVVSGP